MSLVAPVAGAAIVALLLAAAGYFGRQWLRRRSPEEEGMELALVQHDYGNVEEDAKLTRNQVELGKVHVRSFRHAFLCCAMGGR